MGEQWAATGLYARDEMQTYCCYAVQVKTWVNDLDGNEWEVFLVLQDNLPEVVKASSCCVPTQKTKPETAKASNSALTVLDNQQGSSCCG